MFSIQTISTWGTLALLLVAGLFWWWSTQYLAYETSSAIKLLIRVLRAFGLVFLVLLLSDLKISLERQRLVQPSVVMYLDNSPSMMSHRNAVLDSAEVLSQRAGLPLRTVEFSDAVAALTDFQDYRINGESTNLSIIEDDLRQKSRTENVVAGLVISDGAHNSGVLSVDHDIRDNTPVYTLFVGDSASYPDIGIDDFRVPGIVYAGDSLSAGISIEAENVQQQAELQLSMEANERTLHRKTISLTSGEYLRTESIPFSLEEPGNVSVQINIDSLPEERNLQNNMKVRQVTVRPSRYQVLVLAGAPSFESRFLLKAINNMERFNVQKYFTEIANSQEVLNQFVESADILYTLGAPLSEMGEGSVTARLRDMTGSVHQMNSSGRIENVDIRGEISWHEETVSIRNTGNNPFSGLFGPSFHWEELPPIWVAEHPSAGNGTLRGNRTNFPLLTLQVQDGKKTAFLAGQHLWRWDFTGNSESAGHSEMYSRFLEQLFYWIIQEPDTELLQVYLDRVEGNRISATAQIFNSAAQLVTTARIKAEVLDSTGTRVAQDYYRYSSDSYRMQTSIDKTGKYFIQTTAITPNDTLTDTTETFTINAINRESTSSAGNTTLLRNFAQKRNGYMLSSISEFPFEKIEQAEPIVRNYSNLYSLRTNYFLWGLLVLLFVTDWLIRRRHSLL